MKESSTVAQCKRLLNRLRTRADVPVAYNNVHGSKYSRSGEPDLDIVVRGYSVKVELKAPGKRGDVTDIQRHRLQVWRDAGATAAVCTSRDELAWVLIAGSLIRLEEAVAAGANPEVLRRIADEDSVEIFSRS